MLEDKTGISRSTKLEVHTFQINVPVGDCAIHLLVKNAARFTVKTNTPEWQLPKHRIGNPWASTLGPAKRGTVIAALLFDGGFDAIGALGSTFSAERIEKAVKDIEEDYIFDYEHHVNVTRQEIGVEGTPLRRATVQEQLIFDAWIVTHWDRDHYCGSLRLIHDDLAKQRVDYLAKKAADPQAYQNAGNPPFRSSYFRYGKPGADGSPKCGSVLYCPSWTNSSTSTKKVKTDGDGTSNECHQLFDKKLDDGHARMAIVFRKEPKVKTPKKTQKAPPKKPPKPTKPPKPIDAVNIRALHNYDKVKSERLFKVVCKYTELIGLDLFTDKLCHDDATDPLWWQQPGHDVKSVCEKAPQPADGSHWPVFLCMGAAGYVFGQTEAVKMPSGTHYTVDNYNSILAVLAWPHEPKFRMSHLCGGDAHMITEKAMMAFLKPSNVTEEETYIEVLKAAHHGARTSTPSNLLRQCKPKKFVISAGDSHGHPSAFTYYFEEFTCSFSTPTCVL